MAAGSRGDDGDENKKKQSSALQLWWKQSHPAEVFLLRKKPGDGGDEKGCRTKEE